MFLKVELVSTIMIKSILYVLKTLCANVILWKSTQNRKKLQGCTFPLDTVVDVSTEYPSLPV